MSIEEDIRIIEAERNSAVRDLEKDFFAGYIKQEEYEEELMRIHDFYDQDILYVRESENKMAVKKSAAKTATETTIEAPKIELLKQVYHVNGNFYKTKSEAELSLLEEEAITRYYKRYSGYTENQARSQARSVMNRSGNRNTMVYWKDVLELLAEKDLLK